jgi:hypothetical protein
MKSLTGLLLIVFCFTGCATVRDASITVLYVPVFVVANVSVFTSEHIPMMIFMPREYWSNTRRAFQHRKDSRSEQSETPVILEEDVP